MPARTHSRTNTQLNEKGAGEGGGVGWGRGGNVGHEVESTWEIEIREVSEFLVTVVEAYQAVF